MSRDAAIHLALGDRAPAVRTASREGGGADHGPGSAREIEVARLVAGGLTNREIGARLFIPERTVDSHVRSIMNTLGFNARTQIAGWVRVEEP